MRPALATLALVVGTVMGAGSAQAAGPSPSQPATTKMTRAAAHKVAVFAWDNYMLTPLPRPHHGSVGRCVGGPRVWRCPATVTSPDSRCAVVVWVWADAPRMFAEFHRLTCG